MLTEDSLKHSAKNNKNLKHNLLKLTPANKSVMLKTLNDLKSGRLNLFGYLDGLCDKIEQKDPLLRCFVKEENRRLRLRNDAVELLKKYPNCNHRPALFGLAVGVKDIYRVDGLDTACGSKLPASVFRGAESDLVRCFKEAGAIVIGKTETTEFAWFEPAATRNPLNPEHTPGGSSSGSAAAVAAGFVPMALGTQTIGSVIRPAAFCGVVGVKPSAGSLSTQGIIPFSQTFDQPGYFTQDLESAEFVASVICSEWQLPVEESAGDVASIDEVATKNSKTPLQDEPGVNRKLVVGIPAEAYLRQAEADVLSSFWRQVQQIADHGHKIVKTQLFCETDIINKNHKALAAEEFADVHKHWSATYGHLYSSHSSLLIADGKKVGNDYACSIIEHRSHISKALKHMMHKEGIDCWISPAATSLPPHGLASTGSPLMNLPWTYTGVPCITTPINDKKLPFPAGLQISGRMNGLKDLFSCTKTIRKSF